MRDKLKNKDYFEKYLNRQNKRIEKYKELAIKVQNERPDDSGSIKRANGYIESICIDKFNCLYSMGRPMEVLRDFYPEIIEAMKKGWSGKYRYVDLLWVLSIGIMLDVSQIYIIELEKLVEKEKLNDYLIDFLFRYRDENWEGNTTEFIFADPYESIYYVTNAESRKESVEKLKDYLEKKWYEGHSDTGWYDSHENKNDIYNGYWSFESGAIAKILKLDDSALKDTPYYPYDMVHYKEK
ncbi:DUF1911 domain-containing protein [Priestia filamentosa]|uniref:PoNe immunity protein domain-containing protein n=1 Tax=Priestia filamentosa TaxID=1402861 RepID=UPI001C1E2BEA|nr:PoNe immunity protein domain-containing protein [Priestia filamentosa]